jgi:hypothetical protein
LLVSLHPDQFAARRLKKAGEGLSHSKGHKDWAWALANPFAFRFAKGLAGVLMIAGALTWLSVPMALFIGTIGAVSVFKAVYIDKRELKCACVGGSSNVPLGFISLSENLMMVSMAVWMGLTALGLVSGGLHG